MEHLGFAFALPAVDAISTGSFLQYTICTFMNVNHIAVKEFH